MSLFLAAVAGQGGIKVPGAPGTLSLSNGSTSGTMINLSWSAPSDTGGGTISGYRIKKDGSVLVADTSSTGTTYTATGLTRLTEYNFNVAAINEKGTGADGNTPAHTTTAEVPDAPGTLSLAAGADPFDAINLSWSAPGDTGGAAISGYRIKKDGSTLVADTGSTGTTYTATGLAVGTSYNFNVAAINSIGTGADGNTPSLSTASNMSITVVGSPTETIYSGYKSFKFTGSGSFQITSNPSSSVIDILVVGGGGGSNGGMAGAPYSVEGTGGGGGGGVRSDTGATGAIDTWTVTVGGGNAGGQFNYWGGESACELSAGAFELTGGAGSWYGSGRAAETPDGGSGAGGSARAWPGFATYAYTTGGAGSAYGNNGESGYTNYTNTSTNQSRGGGGGGSGGNGTAAGDGTIGVGGAGTASTWFDGTTDYYGGGGGGGSATQTGTLGTGGDGGSGGGGDGGRFYRPLGVNTNERAAVGGGANTGGGSGGACTSDGGVIGGSGVVIIRVPWGT